MSKKNGIKDALAKLQSIAEWFEKERELDVEEGLAKVKDGITLVKDLKERLRETENEFNEIRKGLEEESAPRGE